MQVPREIKATIIIKIKIHIHKDVTVFKHMAATAITAGVDALEAGRLSASEIETFACAVVQKEPSSLANRYKNSPSLPGGRWAE